VLKILVEFNVAMKFNPIMTSITLICDFLKEKIIRRNIVR